MNTRKNTILIVLVVFLIGLIITSGSYAYFAWSGGTNKNIIFNTAGNLKNYIVYDEGESKFVGDFKVSNSYNQGIHSTISLYKTQEVANVNLLATIHMDINAIGANMKKSTALKWVVTQGTSTNIGQVLAQGNFIDANAGDTLTLVPNIEVTTTETFYTIWIWLDASENPSDALSGETLDTNVWTEINQLEGTEDRFEVTRINANYQTISATVVDNKYKVTNYKITTSNTTPSSWENIDSADQNYVYNLTESVSATGTYYVWFKDSAGKTTSKAIQVTSIDNTAPSCSFGSWSPVQVANNETSSIQLTCTDAESQITVSNLTVSDINKSNSNITVTNITKTSVTNGYRYTITVKGTENDGETVLTLPAGKVKNAVNLGNGVATSTVIAIANQYTVKFATGNNNCTLNSTTYADKTPTYGTAFTIANPSCTGYTFDGWTASNTLDTTNAKYGTSQSAVTTTWSNASTKVKATWFNNLAQRSSKTVTLTANWSANPLTFTGKTITKSFSTSAQTETNGINAASNGSGTYTYTITDGNSNSYFGISGRNLTIKANTPVNTDGYQITVRATDSVTNAYKEATYTIIINPIDAKCPTTITSYSGTYDGSSHTITVSNDAEGGTVQYRTSTTGSWSATKPTRTDAGTTTVYMQVAADSNHSTVQCYVSGTTNASIAISAKTLTVPSSPSDKTYNGSSQASGITCPTGSTASGTQSATNASSTAYTQTCTLSSTTNYKWNDNTTTAKNITWKINPKALTITAKDQSISYGGSIATGTGQITSSGLVSGHSVSAITLTPSTSNVTTTGTIAPSAATIKDGSNNTVTNNYSITYTNGSLTITSIPAKCPTTITSYSGTYDGSSHTITVSNDAEGGTVQYRTSTTGSWSTTKPTRTDAGITTVYMQVAADSNHSTVQCYASGTTNASIAISAKTLTVPSSPSDKTYNGSSQASGITCPTGSTASGTQSATNASSTAYTQTCTLSSTTNYKWNDNTTTAKNITWKINPKALTSTQITAYSTDWVSGATTYTRSVSTGVGSETVSLTYTPYANTVGTYTYATSSGSGKFTLSQTNTNYSISSAGNFTITDSVDPTVNDIGGGTTLKVDRQTLTLKCTDDVGVAAYYFGTTNPTNATSITTNTSSDLTALQGSSGLSKEVTAEGTYYFACKDASGHFAKKSIIIRKYQVQAVLEKISGNSNTTYTSTYYENSGTAQTYIVKEGTSLTLASIYTKPTGGDTFKGYSTAAPSTAARTMTTTAPTMPDNNTTVYYMWFTRARYNVTVTKNTNGKTVASTVTQTSNSVTVNAGASADGTLTVKYGDTVTATATPNTGYSFSSWSGGYVSGSTSPVTGGAVTANKTITAGFSGNTYTATFYYNSNTTSGSLTVATKTASCTVSSGSNCTVTVPTEVSSSVGKYNSAYHGVVNATSNMGTTSTITLTADATYYANYSSAITIYYPTSASALSSSATALYRNEYFTSTTAMGVVTSTANNNTTQATSVTLSSLFGTLSGLNATINNIASGNIKAINSDDVKQTNTTTYYAVTTKAEAYSIVYNSNATCGSFTKATDSSSTATSTYYIKTTSAATVSHGSATCSPSSTVSGSKGKYNSAYKGLSSSSSTITNTTSCTGGSTYYAYYSSGLSITYLNSATTTTSSSSALYRNEYFSSTTAMTTVTATSQTSTTQATSITLSNLYGGFAGLATSNNTTTAYAVNNAANVVTPSACTATYYAVSTYSVTYSKGSNVSAIGTTSGSCSATTSAKKCSVTLPTITANTGYTSVGWSTTNGATTGTAAGSSYELTTTGSTLYANAVGITYTIHYATGNNNCTLNSTTYADNNTSFDTVVNIPNPTCTGYTFSGWVASGDFNSTTARRGTTNSPSTVWDGASSKNTYFKNLSTTNNGTVTMTAGWTANTNTPYVVNHYMRNMGENRYTLDSTDNLTGTTNATLTLSNLTKSKTGYTYLEGYANDGNTEKPLSGKVTTTTILPDGSRVINLYYRRNYLYVKYNMNGGTLIPHGNYNSSGDFVTNSNTNYIPTNFRRGVYGGNVGDVDAGTLEGTLGFHNYNSTDSIEIAKTGYKAVSGQQWCNNANGTGTCYSQTTTTYDAIAVATACGADLGAGDAIITLYVNWTPEDYTISYDLDGGTVSSANPTSYTIESNAITLNNPTKEGYTFAGWTGSNGTTPQTTVTIAAGSTGNKTYTANWTTNSYTITINAGNGMSKVALTGWTNTGTASMTKSLAYGSTLDLDSITPTLKTGYTGKAYVKTSGSGSLNNHTFTVGAGVTTITINATGIDTPTCAFTGMTTKVYNYQATTITATNTTSYDSSVSLSYTSLYYTPNDDTIVEQATKTTNTFSVSKNSYLGTRYYGVRIVATGEGNLSAQCQMNKNDFGEMTLKRVKISFNATTNGGTLSGTSPVYVYYGSGNMYTTATGSTTVSMPTATKTGYAFNGWYTAATNGSQVANSTPALTGTAVSSWTNASKQWVITSVSDKTLYAQFTDDTDPTVTLDGGGAIQSTSQTLNLKCSDNVGVTAYYFGQTNPTTASAITTTTNLASIISSSGYNQSVTQAGTYYLACKDSSGNFDTKNIVIANYTINTLVEKINGTADIYTSDNYASSVSHDYIIATGVGTTLPIMAAFNMPNASSSANYKGYSTSYSTTAVTLETANPTVVDGTTYYIWLNRNKYNVQVTKPTNGSITAATVTQTNNSVTASTSAKTLVVKYGDTVTATATPNTGYAFSGWSGGYVSGSTNPVTGSTVGSAKTITATFTDTAPTAAIANGTTLKKTIQPFKLTCTDGVGVNGYYWGTTQPNSTGSNVTFTSVTSTTSWTLTGDGSTSGGAGNANSATTYYLACRDTSGNVTSTSVVVNSYTVKNMLQNPTGTNAYTTNIYTLASENTYFAKNGTTLTLASIYTVPTGSNANRFVGVSEGAPSTTAATPSTTAPTLNSNNTYTMWFTRNVVNFKYATNNGMLQAQTHAAGSTTWATWAVNGSGRITKNGTELATSIRYGNTSLDLANYNNVNALYITKYGYTAPSGAQWICDSGCTTANKTFSHAAITLSSTDDVCNASASDCTVVIKVNWQVSNNTITYELNGGTVSPANPTSYNITTSTITLNNPTKSGYTFAGWTEQISLGWNTGFLTLDEGYAETSSTYPDSYFSSPIRLKSGSTYTLSGYGAYDSTKIRWRVYDTNGVYIGNGSNTDTYTPTSDCYARVLFYDTSTSDQRSGTIITSNVGTTATIPTGSTRSRTYIANWTANTYTVNLNNNSGTGGTTVIYEKYATGWYSDSSATTSITSVTPPTRSGYTFGGYYLSTDTNFTGTQWIDASGTIKLSATATSVNNITLKAKWTANAYTVHFMNGNTDGTAAELDTVSCTYGTACTLTTWANLGGIFPYSSDANTANGQTNYGWSFNGWSTSTSSATVTYSNGGTINISTYAANVYLYSVGRKTYKFYGGYHETTSLIATKYQYWNPYSTSTTSGNLTAVDIPNSIDPNNETNNWEFYGYVGGSNSSNSTIHVAASYAGSAYVIPHNTGSTGVMRSKYIRTLTINYNANGGSGTMTASTATQYCNSGTTTTNGTISSSSITLKDNTFTKTNYAFSKWAAGSASGTQYSENTAYTALGSTVALPKTETMYATWTLNSYTITINAGNGMSTVALSGWTNTGTGSMTKSMTYGSTLDLSTITATLKTGYEGKAYAKASGSGSISGNTFTVGAGTATISVNATSLVAPTCTIQANYASRIYNYGAITLTATSMAENYDSGVTINYSFGNASSTSATLGNWTAAQTGNTYAISKTAYKDSSKYWGVKINITGEGNLTNSCESATGGTTSANTVSDRVRAILRNADINFDATTNGGTINGVTKLYAEYNNAAVFTGRYNSTAGTIPTASKEGYTFTGWWSAASGGSLIINPSGNIQTTAVSSWINASGKWVITSTSNTAKILYAQFTDPNPPEVTIETSYNSNTVSATVTATDSGSGVEDASNWGWSVSTSTTCDSTVSFNTGIGDTYNFNITSAGIHYVCVRVKDNAGNTTYEKKAATASYVEYNYTGAVQTFTAPENGYYKVEAWGAQGGNSTYNSNGTGSTVLGAYGGETSGYIYLNAGDNLYVYVGSQGANGVANTTAAGGYNGGGTGGSGYQGAGGGGGATDIRTTNGAWNNTTSLNSRIMVAGGGGGASNYTNAVPGGAGGNLFGVAGQLNVSHASHRLATGGKQTSGGVAGGDSSSGGTGSPGEFGIGGNSQAGHGGGGGAGYYGGGGAGYIDSGVSSGAGGSSFISGFAGSNAITSASSRTHTNNTKHYTNRYFINGSMQQGVRSGNGKAIITFVGNAPSRINTAMNSVRYIKSCMNMNSVNTGNHWIELQAIAAPGTVINNIDVSGTNLIRGKTITGSEPQNNSTTNAYSYIVDGIIDNYTDNSGYGEPLSFRGNLCVSVDLGGTYDLDEIAVWPFFHDGRTYYNNNVYVSSNNTDWTMVIADSNAETPNGDRASAYYTNEFSSEATSYQYPYAGYQYEYSVPVSGYYRLAGKGGQGGNGGHGGWAEGWTYLTTGEKIYVYVGGAGGSNTSVQSNPGGWNGGGAGGNHTGGKSYGGGGATDFRLVNGTWDDTTSLNSRIFVVGGGGGYYTATGQSSNIMGPGGGLVGGEGDGTFATSGAIVGASTQGGTQTSGGNGYNNGYSYSPGGFGYANQSVPSYWGGGGGSGYYGGGRGYGKPGGGGSSFISGYAGVNAITSASSRTHTNNTLHYSGKYFIKGSMISNYDGSVGNGHANINYYGPNEPTRVNAVLNGVRYIKDCVNGSNLYPQTNAWVELQAIKNGVNVAKSKTVTGTSTVLTTQGTGTYNTIVDGDITSANFAKSTDSGYQCITVDLTQAYDLDEIAVWHIWADGRTFVNNTTYVSSNGTTWLPAISNNDSESVDGKRASAYYNSDSTMGYGFIYTGAVQTYTIPTTGYYRLEVSGAEGGNSYSETQGKGGYASGIFRFNANDVLNIYVGGKGTDGYNTSTSTGNCTTWQDNCLGGWNGGGNGHMNCGGGGGATDIRYGGTALANRIIVAGGGGGGGYDGHLAGAGGNAVAGNGALYPSYGGGGATLSSGNALGIGGSDYYGGGGGGYYGGDDGLGGGGGSSFIAGSTTDGCTSTLCPAVNGKSSSASSWQQGVNSGYGYASITFIGE